MNTIRFVKGAAKFIMAGIVAIVALSVIFTFYSLMPSHIANPAGNTDYVRQANSYWINMKEGISWGQFDAQGYNNAKVIENPDVVVLGSSHTEALYVMQDENLAALLGEKLDGTFTVSNKAIAGHDFLKNCFYLPANLTLYKKAPKVIVLETSSVALTEESVDKVIQGTVEVIPSYETGLMVYLQKLPFLRVMYHQYLDGLLKLFMPSNPTPAPVAVAAEPASSGQVPQKVDVDLKPYDKLFGYLGSLQETHGTRIVIFYHPAETIQKDGSIAFTKDENLEAFAQASEKHDITFVDMAEDFQRMYETSHLLPHGFITGKVGVGHLNPHGHKAIAEELYNTISELDKQGKLCK